MERAPDQITITDGPQSLAPTIEGELLQALRSALPQADNISMVLEARGSQGALVGGLTASTSYGWLSIKTLWVAEAQRHHGLGRRLMEQAEQRARHIGCHAAWLDTSSPDAMQFYAKLGYATFGQLTNEPGQHPDSHRRWFMKKAL